MIAVSFVLAENLEETTPSITDTDLECDIGKNRAGEHRRARTNGLFENRTDKLRQNDSNLGRPLRRTKLKFS